MRECSLASMVLVGLCGEESAVASSFQYLLSVGKCCKGYEKGTAVWKQTPILNSTIYTQKKCWSKVTEKSMNIAFRIAPERKIFASKVDPHRVKSTVCQSYQEHEATQSFSLSPTPPPHTPQKHWVTPSIRCQAQRVCVQVKSHFSLLDSHYESFSSCSQNVQHYPPDKSLNSG